MGWTRGRALAWALQLALCGAAVCFVKCQEWQVAAVRVDSGPLNRTPPQAALRAVNATFVRSEQKRFWLGCRQLSVVGFNSYTLIEQAAEERL